MKNSIFPVNIPAEEALSIHDCVCIQLNAQCGSQDEPISDEDALDELLVEVVNNDEIFVCSVCGEWTSDEDSCCDAGPSNHEYERDYER